MTNILRFPLLVLALSVVALWLSVRIGVSFRKRRRSLEENEREDFGIIMAAILTLLGLIIGFSFSMAITRYDQRKKLEETEANALARNTSGRTCCPPLMRQECERYSRTISTSVFYFIKLGMTASLGRSMPLPLNWRPACGPLSRLRLRRSRHP